MSGLGRAYATVTKNSLMSTFTYRAHFLFQIFGSVVGIVVLWYLWHSIYTGSGQTTLRGMTFEQTFLYVGLGTALFVLMRTWAEWFINGQIRSGDIVVHFFRPYDHMAWTFADNLGQVIGNLITITIPSLAVIFLVFQMPLPDAAHALLAVPAIVQAFLLSFLIDYFIGITAFWTESIWGISAGKDILVLLLSGAMVPLPWFPEAVRGVLQWLPFASLYNTPLSLLAGAPLDPVQVLGRLGLQTAWIVVLFFGVRAYFRMTSRKLTVAGG
jgi:ABC-2 type transport system permease protein